MFTKMPEGTGLTTHIGPATWSFSQSWASNITAVGALLGTILTALEPELRAWALP